METSKCYTGAEARDEEKEVEEDFKQFSLSRFGEQSLW